MGVSQPAWYPDPSGQPNSYRYWNGQSWSAETTSNPYADPPPSVQGQAPGAPQQPQPSAQQPQQQWSPQGQQSQGWPGQESTSGQQWSPMPSAGGGNGGGGKGKLWVLIGGVLAVLILVGGGIAAVLTLGDDDSDDKKASDDSSQTDDPTDEPTTDQTDEPTDGPTDAETSGAPVLETCPTAGPAAKGVSKPGQVSGGGISFPLTNGYSDGADADQNEDAFDFLSAPNGQMKVIEKTKDSGWISMVVVGSVKKSDGYTDVQQAAESIAGCMARSTRLYRNVTDIRPGASEALDVGGHDAWRVDTEIEINEPKVKATGDTAVVVAVDTGDPETFAIFAGVVPIGDTQLLEQLNAAVAGITVD